MCSCGWSASSLRDLRSCRLSARIFHNQWNKGKGINRASGLRNDSISVAPGQHVHPNCRRDYCRDRHLLRYQRYLEKLACKSKSIQPQSLPPTSSAVKYHSLRVYLQTREWKDSTEGINYAEWGWRSAAEQLTPIMTDLAPAPQSLLWQMMGCNCLQDCCRKNDLPCNPACGQCKGSACTNAPKQIPDDEDSDSDSG